MTVRLETQREDLRRWWMRQPGRLARAFRTFIGSVYLLGAPTHVYFALFNPQGYRDMSEWAPPISELARFFWESWFLPNARLAGLGVALMELTIAVLILSRGVAARLGFFGALKFHGLLAALFGMWPYTLPMIALLGLMTIFDFRRGPTTALLRRVAQRNQWSSGRNSVVDADNQPVRTLLDGAR